ncbi:hypothetical protein [Cupriavidus sp. 8B]
MERVSRLIRRAGAPPGKAINALATSLSVATVKHYSPITVSVLKRNPGDYPSPVRVTRQAATNKAFRMMRTKLSTLFWASLKQLDFVQIRP